MVTGVSLAALFGAVPAGADTSHNPFGFLDVAQGGPNGALLVQGWAADPDALTTPLVIVDYVDGQPFAQTTNMARADVAAARHTGVNVGYTRTLYVTPGTHKVCTIARNIGAGASTMLGCLTSTVPAPSAAALAHYPVGRIDTATVKGTTVAVTGWALDPDQPKVPLGVTATVDGQYVAAVGMKSNARPDVSKAMSAGPDQGYSFSVTLPNGAHTLCVNAANVGPGGPQTVACAPVQIGPTAAQIQAQSPVGALQVAQPLNSNTISVRGWATDPNNKNYPLSVVAYVDGSSLATGQATLSRPDLANNPAAGSHSGFAVNVGVSSASHIVCIWAVNIGIGVNKSLGCAPVSTAGDSLATGPRPAPNATGIKIVAAAKKFLGGKYVWGAENPAVGFDCSGLVQYTYRSLGISTPRVAQDQFNAAHLITAGRAVPGDLVFYHDDEGNVYHVGIYVSPGYTYAAVDEQEGIKVQPIWDDTATYGSFTHS